MIGDVLNNMDWCGYFRTWSEQIVNCDSEEDLYRKLRRFKEDFNPAYGRLSRIQRMRSGFRYKECDCLTPDQARRILEILQEDES